MDQEHPKRHSDPTSHPQPPHHISPQIGSRSPALIENKVDYATLVKNEILKFGGGCRFGGARRFVMET